MTESRTALLTLQITIWRKKSTKWYHSLTLKIFASSFHFQLFDDFLHKGCPVFFAGCKGARGFVTKEHQKRVLLLNRHASWVVGMLELCYVKGQIVTSNNWLTTLLPYLHMQHFLTASICSVQTHFSKIEKYRQDIKYWWFFFNGENLLNRKTVRKM